MSWRVERKGVDRKFRAGYQDSREIKRFEVQFSKVILQAFNNER